MWEEGEQGRQRRPSCTAAEAASLRDDEGEPLQLLPSTNDADLERHPFLSYIALRMDWYALVVS